MPAMAPQTFLCELRTRGVSVSADGDTLRLSGPKAERRPAVLSYLKTFKPQILELLRQESQTEPAPETIDNIHSFTAPLSYREMLLSAFSESWRTVAEVQAALPADFPAADEDAVAELLEEAQRARSIERREFTGVWKWRLVPLSESGITDPFASDANPFPAEKQEVLFSE